MRHYEELQLTNTLSARMISPRGAYYQVCWLGCRRASSTRLLTRGTGGKEKQIRERVLCLTFPLAATRQDCSGCLAFFFFLTTKLYFDMQVLHTIVAKKSASLSARCKSLTACIIHARLRVWGREKGEAAAENHNSSAATNITWNKLRLELHSGKNI